MTLTNKLLIIGISLVLKAILSKGNLSEDDMNGWIKLCEEANDEQA